MSKKTNCSRGILLLILLFPLFTFAQKAITGHVLSKADQSPIAGVSVVIKGTRIGTSTAVDGSFAIKAKEGDVLVVSGVGVASTEAPVNGGDLTIAVAADAKELNQVVVTATGIRKEAKRLGYAIQAIDASQLTAAREPNPVNSLKGNAAGLAVNINSEIGHSPDVIIRGENNPEDRPLFVVDGVPIASDTYNINPDDIETFTILKGPNAAALYGFQGKNGAIIISTKKGSKAKARTLVTVNSSTQINSGFIALPKYQDTYGPGDNGKYAFGGGGSSPASYFGTGAVGVGVNDYDYDVWGPQFRGQLLPQYDGTYTPGQTYKTTFADGKSFTGHVQPTPWVARGKDNLRKFIQTGVLSTNSIAVSSSTEKTDIRISAGNTYQQGVVPNTKLNNANFTASVIQRFNPKLSLTTYFNFSRQSTPNVPDVQYGPNSIIYNIILWGGADWSMNDMKDYWQPGKAGIQQKYAEYYRYNNPYFMSYEWLRGHYQNNEYGYLSLNYKLNNSVDFQFRPSMTAYDMMNNEKLPYSAGVYGRELRQGDYREDRRSLFETNEDLQVRYHRNEIAGFLDLQALAGGTVRNQTFNSDFTSTNYLNVPGIYNFANSLNPVTGISYRSSMLVLSAYYSLDLGYRSYITANITGRVDKSSTLPSNTNSYFYPSFNLASVISEYVHLPSAISFLKVRGSYASSKSGGTSASFSPDITGTPASGYGYYWASPYNGPAYLFSKTYTLSPTYNNQVSAAYTDVVISNNIQTSERKAFEAGLDIRFLNNRLGLDVTRYHYKNTGIVQQLTSQASGYSGYRTNGDGYTNDGWEAVVNGTPISHRDGFSWNVTANFFTFKRKWTNYVSKPDNYEKDGARTDLVYDDAFVRTPDGKMVIDPQSGVYLRYSDVGSSARKVYGHSDPDWQWGLVNTLSYKGFALRFQFDGMVGGVVEDYVRKKTLQAGRHTESAAGALGAARPSDEANVAAFTGDGVILTGTNGIQLDPVKGNIVNMKDLNETKNTVKSQVQPFVTRAASIPDLDIVKKTYAKLREVAITYKIPSTVFGKRSIISDASVSLVGRNLLYFFPDKYKDLDVDQYSQGVYSVGNNGKYSATPSSSSGLQTPTTRSYGINLNFSF
ncbi:MAG: SusC/RagA family TonB-linked outer membrane protein [Bacteroidetes bacterium]|nr:SusC/RagA family TonB-linked outer membrane protein [Bacteroidota bacterium]